MSRHRRTAAQRRGAAGWGLSLRGARRVSKFKGSGAAVGQSRIGPAFLSRPLLPPGPPGGGVVPTQGALRAAESAADMSCKCRPPRPTPPSPPHRTTAPALRSNLRGAGRAGTGGPPRPAGGHLSHRTPRPPRTSRVTVVVTVASWTWGRRVTYSRLPPRCCEAAHLHGQLSTVSSLGEAVMAIFRVG